MLFRSYAAAAAYTDAAASAYAAYAAYAAASAYAYAAYAADAASSRSDTLKRCAEIMRAAYPMIPADERSLA